MAGMAFSNSEIEEAELGVLVVVFLGQSQ